MFFLPCRCILVLFVGLVLVEQPNGARAFVVAPLSSSPRSAVSWLRTDRPRTRKGVRLCDQKDQDENGVVDQEASKNDTQKTKDNQEKEEKGVLLEEMDWETSLMEQQASNKVWFSLMAPYFVGRYIYFALWALIIVGYVLNLNGYAFLWKDGHLTIDTLAERLFQEELARGLRETARNASP